MKIILKKPFSAKEVTNAISLMVKKRAVRKNLVKHFGALKRGIDGLDYQHKIRHDWN